MEVKTREITQVKRICQNVDENYQKVVKINALIEQKIAEREELQAEIDEMEAPVLRKFGYRSTDLIEKVIVPLFKEDGSPKLDKNGRAMKQTKYVLKYPDTFLPVVEDTPAAGTIEVPEVETAGSDFDIDSEKQF